MPELREAPIGPVSPLLVTCWPAPLLEDEEWAAETEWPEGEWPEEAWLPLIGRCAPWPATPASALWTTV